MRTIELNFFNTLALACMVFMSVLFMCALLRAVRGPRVTDRLVAVNMIGTMTIAIIAILAEVLGEGGLIDICLIYAMISFLAIVVLVKVYMGVYRQRKIRKISSEQNIKGEKPS
ncbi:MAG: sodium:proton antiporter [Clostridiaceae bacterium]|nr:sodium:proton antiporter [Clostridiaceae bacterium]